MEDEKKEMYEFIESLANSTYMNFENIKGSSNVDRILSMLRIAPKDYMVLIANLTKDLTRRDHQELRVRNQNNLEYIRSDQTLTEYGICYTTNSFIARNLTTRDTTVAQRGCRFFSESNLTHYSIYTKGICLQECRLNIAYQHCGCIPHFYPNNVKPPKPVCDYRTLKVCFPPLKQLFLEFREDHDGHDSIDCYCEQNCVDSKVIIERTQVLVGTRKLLGSNGGLVLMKRYPLIRFSRQVLFTFTDLLVSIGGTAGLFLGFSVLGVVEIIYFFTLRLVWYCLGRR
ncbi:sodium channel protein Nach [Armigeres subalbatus]|uniref:sodium channel protein Nach n=1 Tax=Armigeres subalbatus TaxID=124917 RepID=UPI002ED555D7